MERRKDDSEDPSITFEENDCRTVVIGRLKNLKEWKKGNDKVLEKRGKEIALKAAIKRWEKRKM
jgi:hypothetical protein